MNCASLGRSSPRNSLVDDDDDDDATPTSCIMEDCMNDRNEINLDQTRSDQIRSNPAYPFHGYLSLSRDADVTDPPQAVATRKKLFLLRIPKVWELPGPYQSSAIRITSHRNKEKHHSSDSSKWDEASSILVRTFTTYLMNGRPRRPVRTFLSYQGHPLLSIVFPLLN